MRQRFPLAGMLAALLLLGSPGTRTALADPPRIPVILDTDIGTDIDDTWALIMLLRSPRFDVKLVIGDGGKPLYRARLIAKILEIANRTDVPVGIGLGSRDPGANIDRQSAWVSSYDLKKYPGRIYDDGVQAMIDTINESEKTITVIAIGPLPNIAAALRRDRSIAQKARLVGMHGSVRKGYQGQRGIAAEYNVRKNVAAAQKVLSAPWKELKIAPLDSCGTIRLSGRRYAAIVKSRDPLARALVENYRHWAKSDPRYRRHTGERSSTLFDTVAIYLAYSEAWLNVESLRIRVDNKGYTRRHASGHPMRVATSWKNRPAFLDLIVKLVTARPQWR